MSQAADLAPAFAAVVGGLAGVAAQHVVLCVRPLAAARPTLSTAFHVEEKDDGSLEVRIPDVLGGARQDVLLDWKSEEVGEARLLALVAVRYLDPRRCAHVCLEGEELVVDTADRQPEEEPDVEVAVQRTRWEAARALEEAAALGAAGDVEGARGLLAACRSRAEKLLARCSTAPCQGLVADLTWAATELDRQRTWNGAAATLQAAAHGRLLQRHVTSSGSDATDGQRRWMAASTA